MAQPQSGILPEANQHASFLTFALQSNADPSQVRRAAGGLPGLTEELARLDPGAGLASVISFGDSVWNTLYPKDRPEGLAPFQPFDGDGRSAPATTADMLLHLRAERRDLLFELTRRFRERLGDAATLVEEVQGFRYFDKRDLTGFVDGTENPQGLEDRSAVALLADGPFAGGSFVNIQRYIHDLAKWQAVAVPEQENIIGRTKADDIEFEGDRLPPTAHIARVSIKDEGKSLKLLRHSMPFASGDEQGLLFIAYAARPDSFARMLEAMIVASDEGHYDHLMDYTRAVTGASFFAPSVEWLEATGG